MQRLMADTLAMKMGSRYLFNLNKSNGNLVQLINHLNRSAGMHTEAALGPGSPAV
jgi:hypothetical protein